MFSSHIVYGCKGIFLYLSPERSQNIWITSALCHNSAVGHINPDEVCVNVECVWCVWYPRHCSRAPYTARSPGCVDRGRTGPAEPSASSASSSFLSHRWRSCMLTTETSWSKCTFPECRLNETKGQNEILRLRKWQPGIPKHQQFTPGSWLVRRC